MQKKNLVQKDDVDVSYFNVVWSSSLMDYEDQKKQPDSKILKKNTSPNSKDNEIEEWSTGYLYNSFCTFLKQILKVDESKEFCKEEGIDLDWIISNFNDKPFRRSVQLAFLKDVANANVYGAKQRTLHNGV